MEWKQRKTVEAPDRDKKALYIDPRKQELSQTSDITVAQMNIQETLSPKEFDCPQKLTMVPHTQNAPHDSGAPRQKKTKLTA